MQATPASTSSLGPSGKGKNASEAATVGALSRILVPAFSIASRHAERRSTRPQPPPSSCLPAASATALDLRCLTTVHAKTASSSTAVVGAGPATCFHSSGHASAVSRSWISMPPAMDRDSVSVRRPDGCDAGPFRSPTASSLTFFQRSRSNDNAASANPGATTTSKNLCSWQIPWAVRASTSRLRVRIPP